PEEPEHEHQRQAGARGQLEVRQPVAVRELEEPRGDEIGRVANVEEDDAELVNEEDRERERELGPAARLCGQVRRVGVWVHRRLHRQSTHLRCASTRVGSSIPPSPASPQGGLERGERDFTGRGGDGEDFCRGRGSRPFWGPTPAATPTPKTSPSSRESLSPRSCRDRRWRSVALGDLVNGLRSPLPPSSPAPPSKTQR